MKNSYPIILTPDEVGFTVYIPDFEINTEGDTLTEAIEMARDAIGLMGIDMEDDKKALPMPSEIGAVDHSDNDIVTLVDVDFSEYRRKNDMRSVRRNVTLPSWLDYEAEKSGLNVSAILQKALKTELHISQ
ncbi:MAG: type II toxin-antitoxin system HicB family antitoxin [Oscillospiraceae bacterium]|nr:type II toxin-antitoxin system HicB family antitoxin [Oscillospiraceae bacterium]